MTYSLLLCYQGNTALHIAMKFNKLGSVKQLLTLGANIDAINDVSNWSCKTLQSLNIDIKNVYMYIYVQLCAVFIQLKAGLIWPELE